MPMYTHLTAGNLYIYWDKMGILSFPIMKSFRSLVFIEYKDSYKLLLKTYCRNMEKSIKQMFTVAVHNVQYHITLCFFFILGLSLIARLGKDSATLTPSRLTNKFLAKLKLSPKEAGRYHCHPLGPTFAQ